MRFWLTKRETSKFKIQNSRAPMSSYSKLHSLADVLQALSMTVTVSRFKTCSDHGLTRIQLVDKNRFSISGQAEFLKFTLNCRFLVLWTGKRLTEKEEQERNGHRLVRELKEQVTHLQEELREKEFRETKLYEQLRKKEQLEENLKKQLAEMYQKLTNTREKWTTERCNPGNNDCPMAATRKRWRNCKFTESSYCPNATTGGKRPGNEWIGNNSVQSSIWVAWISTTTVPWVGHFTGSY